MPNLTPTLNLLDPYVCVSAMQKAIRRSDEVRAMQFAFEMLNTSKPYCSMVCNRLIIISHEDIDTSVDATIVPFVATISAQAREFYKPLTADNPHGPCESRMFVGNAIRLMCRSTKNRAGDNAQAAIGIAMIRDGFKPEIPDYVYDKHTHEGRKQGRGVSHFLESSVVLKPPRSQQQVEELEKHYAEKAAAVWLEAERRRGAKQCEYLVLPYGTKGGNLSQRRLF